MSFSASEPAAGLAGDAHALRRLARSLLSPEDAEDVAQQAQMASLATRGTPAQRMPWLRGVVRKLALATHRANARRAHHTRAAAAAPAPIHDPATMAMEAELVRDVGAAVHDLDEPYRTAVLLRFWHDLPTREIARDLGVPHDTVRSRVQRGLAQLRSRLDRRYGTRAVWSGPLAAIAAPAPAVGAAAFWMTSLLMNKTLVLAAGLCAAAALALAWSSSSSRTATPEPTTSGSAAPVAAATSARAAPDRQPLAEGSSATPALAPRGARVVGRCLDAALHPIEGGTAYLHPPAADTCLVDGDRATVTTGVDGTFALEVEPLAMDYQLQLRAPTCAAVIFPCQDLTPGRTRDLGDLTLPAGGSVLGCVRRPDGVPQPDANVTVALVDAAAPDADVLQPVRLFTCRTGRDGSFRLAGMPLVPGTWAAMLDAGPAATDHSGRATFEVVAGRVRDGVVLTCPTFDTVLVGEVQGPHGEPLADATVQRTDDLLAASIPCDAEGRFALPRRPDDPTDRVRLRVWAPGHDATVDAFAWHETAHVTLQPCAAVIVDVCRDADGRAVEAFALRLTSVAAPGAGLSRTLALALPCQTRPRGEVILRGLPSGEYRAWVEPADDGVAAFVAEFDVESVVTTPHHVHLRAPTAGVRVVRVVDDRDGPIAGSRIQLVLQLGDAPPALSSHAVEPGAWDLAAVSGALVVQEATTDAAGEANLRGAVAAGLSLRVLGPGHRPTVVPEVRLDPSLPPLVVRVDVGATIAGRLGPAHLLRQLAPSTEEDAMLRQLGAARAGVMGASLHPRVLVRSVGDPQRTLPEHADDGVVARDGSFHIDGVSPGSWEVCLDYRLPGLGRGTGGRALAVLATVRDLRPMETRTVELDGSALASVTLRAQVLVDGEPWRDADASLLRRGPGLRWGTLDVGELAVPLRTDAGGRFAVDVAPGTYSVEVALSGDPRRPVRLRTDQVVEVVAGRDAECAFALQRSCLRVRVQRADGTPERQRAFMVMQARYFASAGRTDDDGWITLDPVLPGDFDLVAWPEDLEAQAAQTRYIKEHPYPEWLQALVRVGPLRMPPGERTAEIEARLPR
ncbi:MAG: sigma-70 family RNA polymerase sigma factor [Planctomycetota bacterium]